LTFLVTACSDSVSKSDATTGNSTVNQSQHEEIVITMAMTGDSSNIEKDIQKFNTENNGYKIEIKRYSKQTEDNQLSYEESIKKFQYEDLEILQDIINSSEIDIVCNESFFNESYYEILKEKGAFVDLYSFMNDDIEVNTDTLDTHILNLNETKEKLYTLPVFYAINTLAGETQYVGNKENWNFEEFESHWNAMPTGSTIMGARQKEKVYPIILRNNLDSFIDYNSSEVHFDSPDFKKMLEFCNTFESANGQKGTYDYESISFVNPIIATGIMASPTFNPDNGLTCVGYPSQNGKGAYLSSAFLSFSINMNSSKEKQKIAWEFIRSFATEDYQLNNVIPFIDGTQNTEAYYSTEIGYCVNKKAFDTIAEKMINKECYTSTFTDKGQTFERRFPTQKDVDALRRYISLVKRWGTPTDSSLSEIINDEVLAYFNDEKTVDECIDIIQNRASIWINEQA
jgi:ABC-type glycerol-3-phosphate transport system substrate-binding protein